MNTFLMRCGVLLAACLACISLRAVQSIEDALLAAGHNRPELEQALDAMPGRDMEFLIRTARQYDLANLTADHLVDNLELSRRASIEFRFIKSRIDHALWQTYVLPYRILEEDLENWRPAFFSTLAPLVEYARTVEEAVGIVHEWMFAEQEDGAARVAFVAAENRNQTPMQLLATRKGGCKELHLLFVALLRSVGIPARHCTVTWWAHGDWFHYFMQYYDPDLNDWVSIDASSNPARRVSNWAGSPRGRKIAMAYSFPSPPRTIDLEAKEHWELALDITEMVVDTARLEVRFPETADFVASVYNYNLGAPRLLAKVAADDYGIARFTVSHTEFSQPILVVATGLGAVAWQRVDVRNGETKPVVLNTENSPEVLDMSWGN